MACKILLFMRRRAGMSAEAFRDHYERVHVPLALKYAGGIDRYVRRYVTPQPVRGEAAPDALGFDVITELWFDDERAYRGAVRFLANATIPADVLADEANLFDPAGFRMATIEEIATDLPG